MRFTAIALLRDARFEPVFVALVVAAALWYGWCLRQVSGERTWPPQRTAWFGAGLFFLAAGTQSGLVGLAHHYPLADAISHILVGMAAPVCLALGAPVELTIRALGAPRLGGAAQPAHWRTASQQTVLRVVHGPVVKALTAPVFTWCAFPVLLLVVYFSRLFPYSLHHQVVFQLVQAGLFVAGCLFWWPVVALDPMPRRLSYGRRAVYVLANIPFYTLFGMAELSQQRAPFRGMSLQDWRSAGDTLWTVGEFLAIFVGAVLLYRWGYRERRDDLRLDRWLLRDVDRAAEAQESDGQGQVGGSHPATQSH